MVIDLYCLTCRAEQFGYHSQIIFAGRRINDDMGKFIAGQTVKDNPKTEWKESIKKVVLAVRVN